MQLGKLAAFFFAAVMVTALASSAGAVDGTIEINQAKVLAAGGFPYTIAASGSYRLTGNLVNAFSTNGINVTANNVTIDLNGFSMTGPGGSAPNGINAFGRTGVTVENGRVTGFNIGIAVGTYGIVRNVHADANGATDINVATNSVVEGCTANDAGTGSGIFCTASCSITHNTANGNGSIGIECGQASSAGSCEISGNTANSNSTGISCDGSGCLITNNAIDNNTTRGIVAVDATTGFGGNVLRNTTNFVGGTSIKNNVCTTGGVTSTC